MRERSRHGELIGGLYNIAGSDVRSASWQKLFEDVVERYLPFRDLGELRPARPASALSDVDPDDTNFDWHDDSKPGTIWQLGLQETGEISEWVVLSPESDERAAELAFGRIGELQEEQFAPHFSRADVARYLRAWRLRIIDECNLVATGMARTVKEANAQKLSAPDSVDSWASFALTIDGESVELDLFGESSGIGHYDVGFEGSEDWSSVVEARLALYAKVRILQRKERPATDKELLGISDTIFWVCANQPKTAKGHSEAAIDDLRGQAESGS